MFARCLPFVTLCFASAALANAAAATTNRLTFDTLPQAHFEFAGPVGDRIQANLDEWLLRAPQANPGMLEMFRVRDRQPVPQLVPWAGEFVGKYLISAIQALRMVDDPRLRQQVSNVIVELIATQAEDGYLGPFPKDIRLLKNWDLWGHYHAIQALLLWNQYSGDPAALAAARQAGDLVCNTYLDTGKRVFDAGDSEMNMAILTAMAMLHRVTDETRYLRMAREVEQDWERAGDYLRAGLDGREYYQSPKPRWESLHDLQGLVEMWRITGDPKYRAAFEHHWRSIRRWDRRNTGGFSSGEQATGNPYTPSAIETCCTVAWMAITIDYLQLTGEPQAADALELATLNGGLGAQHPSGRWFTYNTPMDGVREASAHTIVFQSRAGTPELNCCSVNGPRVPGMMSEWAVMAAPEGLVLNWLGAGRSTAKLADGTPVTITSSDDAWRSGRTELRVETKAKHPVVLGVRMPAWAVTPKILLNGSPLPNVAAGSYAWLKREWSKRDKVELSFEMPVRFVPGANEAAGKVSLYRGPLLLAYDQAQNVFDAHAIPPINLAKLPEARVVDITPHRPHQPTATEMVGEPWLVMDVPTADGRRLRLVDFASAGALGTHYRSWLPAANPPPAPAFTQLPADGARVPVGEVRFQWRAQRNAARSSTPALPTSFRVELAANESFAPLLLTTNVGPVNRIVVNTVTLCGKAGPPPGPIYWRVVSISANGDTLPDVPPARFVIDPTAPQREWRPEPKPGPNGELIAHALRGDGAPQFGEVASAKFTARDAEGTEVNGRDEMLIYPLPVWPEEELTVAVRVRLSETQGQRSGQIFSGWVAAMDDPLRLMVDGGKVFARIESGGGFSTPGGAMAAGRWYHVAAVKRGGTLTLFLDGQAVGTCAAPEFTTTQARDCALGGNPHFSGNEFLAARFADFSVFARALSAEEIRGLAGK
ncbi:MAG: glycoside hydrolase family 127 protein [Verrucomicrobia bacterium]|nr:glycoside hydrolase family 127 protein [Verrucomicrobiota bacterium]